MNDVNELMEKLKQVREEVQDKKDAARAEFQRIDDEYKRLKKLGDDIDKAMEGLAAVWHAGILSEVPL
jgi:hypothetical protein